MNNPEESRLLLKRSWAVISSCSDSPAANFLLTPIARQAIPLNQLPRCEDSPSLC